MENILTGVISMYAAGLFGGGLVGCFVRKAYLCAITFTHNENQFGSICLQ